MIFNESAHKIVADWTDQQHILENNAMVTLGVV